MEAFVIIALIGFGLLAAELLLPTGGILAALGIAGPGGRRHPRARLRLELGRLRRRRR